MSVLSDISSKLTQAHSADSEKQRVADYSEAFGYLLADVLNKNSSLINPFIRKGAQRRMHFNELDQAEQEKEALLDYHEKQMAIAAAPAGDGGKGSGKSDDGMGALGGGLMGGLAAIFGRKIMKGFKGVVATGRKAVGSLKEIVGKVIKKVMPRAAAKMATGQVAAMMSGPGAIAVEAGLLAYTLYDVVDELKKELTGSGLFDGFDIASVFPSTDSINEGFDSILDKFAKFGDGVATSITGESGPFQPRLSEDHVSATPTTNTSDLGAATPATNTSDLGSSVSDFEDLKNLIQSAESKEHGYDAVVSNNETPKPPTEMTVGEVLQWQKDMKADPNNAGRIDLTAIGRYQFIHTTLVEALKSTDVKMSDKFDAETQDKLFMARLRYRGLDDYMSKKIDKKQFIHRLSKEWAGLPMDESGKSYHGKDGFNKAHVSYESTYNAVPDPEQLQAAINSREEAKVIASTQAAEAAVAVTPENQTPIILSAEEVNKVSDTIHQKSGDNPLRAKQMQAQYDQQYNQPVIRGSGPGGVIINQPQPARSQESSFSLLQTVEKMLGY